MTITTTLRCSNMDQGPGFVALSTDKASFSFQTPGWLRDRNVRIHLVESAISSQDTGTQTSCLPANTYQLLVRTNISSNSFNCESNGGNTILGTAFFPNGSFNSRLNGGNSLDLGICTLPAVLEIDRIAYSDAGLLTAASAFNVDYKLIPLSVTLLIELL